MTHDHAPSDTSRARLTVALAITGALFATEAIGTAVTGSLSLFVDTGHMLTDLGGLVIALVIASLVRRPASSTRTWGYLRAEVLGALGQSAILLAVGLYAFAAGVQRLLDPPRVPSDSLLLFGVIGLVGNIASIMVLLSARSDNLNLRAAFLEVVNDALGSAAVIISALVIQLTGWVQADALAGMLIAVLIVPRTVKLLRETTSVLLESTPRGLDLDRVRTHLVELRHVRSVHDLHASQVATGLPILSAHVVVEDECFRDGHAPRILDELQTCVLDHFSVAIEHSTFQLETASHAGHEHIEHA